MVHLHPGQWRQITDPVFLWFQFYVNSRRSIHHDRYILVSRWWCNVLVSWSYWTSVRIFSATWSNVSMKSRIGAPGWIKTNRYNHFDYKICYNSLDNRTYTHSGKCRVYINGSRSYMHTPNKYHEGKYYSTCTLSMIYWSLL